MSIEDILEWLQNLDPRMQRFKKQKPYPYIDEGDGWNRLVSGGNTRASKNDGNMALSDLMYSKHPGLIKQWNLEEQANREPLPDPEIGREAYKIMKERKRYKGLL